jgi:hypothetical protein
MSKVTTVGQGILTGKLVNLCGYPERRLSKTDAAFFGLRTVSNCFISLIGCPENGANWGGLPPTMDMYVGGFVATSQRAVCCSRAKQL